MNKILIYIFILLGSNQLTGCYSTIRQSNFSELYETNQRTNFEDIENGESLIEGTVDYTEGGGITWEIFYPSGFILKNYQWVFNAPNYSTDMLYLSGSIDKSYIKKRVQIVGRYHLPEKNSNSAPDYSSKLYFSIKRLRILY
jgi:hypothetical protein